MQPHDVILIIFLFYQSVHDVKKLEIDPLVLMLTLMTGIVYGIVGCREWDVWSGPFSLMPFMILAIMAFLSGGKIGMGDALITLTLGFFLEGEEIMTVLILGSLLSFIYAVVMIIRHKKECREDYPFLPFMLTGYVLSRFLTGWIA